MDISRSWTSENWPRQRKVWDLDVEFCFSTIVQDLAIGINYYQSSAGTFCWPFVRARLAASGDVIKLRRVNIPAFLDHEIGLLSLKLNYFLLTGSWNFRCCLMTRRDLKYQILKSFDEHRLGPCPHRSKLPYRNKNCVWIWQCLKALGPSACESMEHT